jgi:hypothetical protein
MSNVLIGIIGVILFIGLALAGALFLGDRFSNSRTQGEAARYMSEGSQISKAYEMYRINEGAYPTGLKSDGTAYDSTQNKARLVELKEKGYLKSIPVGSTSANPSDGAWYIDNDKGAALTLIGADSGSKSVCVEARKQAGISDPSTIKTCDAADLSNNDPCCSIT